MWARRGNVRQDGPLASDLLLCVSVHRTWECTWNGLKRNRMLRYVDRCWRDVSFFSLRLGCIASDPVRCRGATRSGTRTAALRPILCSPVRRGLREALCGLVLLNVTLSLWLGVHKSGNSSSLWFRGGAGSCRKQRARATSDSAVRPTSLGERARGEGDQQWVADCRTHQSKQDRLGRRGSVALNPDRPRSPLKFHSHFCCGLEARPGTSGEGGGG